MLHFLIVSLGSADLLEIALSSIRKYVVSNYRVTVVPLPLDTTDPREHGRAIDKWRSTYALVQDDDVVVIMDPDVVLLSHQWRKEVEKAFADPKVGIWGAGSRENTGPRVHASMMCIRGKLWNALSWSFLPCPDPREQTWRDTGGLICLQAQFNDWRVVPVEHGPQVWKGVFAWWGMQEYPWATMYATLYASIGPMSTTAREPVPLWTHLGGGSHSDVTRMSWWQRLRRWKQIARRRRFIADAQIHLSSRS